MRSLAQQLDALQQAKDLAFAQARRSLKLHAHHMMQSIETQTERLIEELWSAHCTDMDELTALRESESEKGEEQILLEAWALRSILRFMPRQTDPQVRNCAHC
jgi:hypothetical protein